uniref:Uncharacterized protein n=1 Tax=Arundo donax TaxID=35708 RepID=A0A0A9B8L9_ARUDO
MPSRTHSINYKNPNTCTKNEEKKTLLFGCCSIYKPQYLETTVFIATLIRYHSF